METSDIMVDGVLVISDYWNFVQPLSNVSIKLPLLFEQVDVAKALQGNKTLRQYISTWCINLFTVQDMTIKLCFCSDANVLPYSRVLTLCREALEETFQLIPIGATVMYDHQVSAELKREFRIHVPDYELFGERFTERIRAKIIGCLLHYQGSDVVVTAAKFVGTCFGQSLSANMAASRLNIRWDRIDECVLHFATDYTYQNSSVLWRRVALMQLFGKRPSYEYFPAAYMGRGTFYFIPPFLDCDPAITKIRCYNEFAKHQKSNNKAWKKQCIAEFLQEYDGTTSVSFTRAAKEKANRTVAQYVKLCDKLEQYIGRIPTYPHIAARCECLISATGGSDKFELARKYMENFLLSAKFENINALHPIALPQFQERVSSAVLPAVGTIRMHLDGLLEALALPTNVYQFSLKDFMDVCASEMIICFILYGSVQSQRGSRAHCNDLARELQLMNTSYRGEIVEGILDAPLGARKVGWIQNRLSYIGRVVPRAFAYTNMFPNFPQISTFVQALGRFAESYEDYDACFTSLSLGMVFSSLHAFGDRGDNIVRTTRYSEYRGWEKRIIHVEHLVKELFRCPIASLAGHTLFCNLRLLVESVVSEEPNVSAFIEAASFFVNFHLKEMQSPMIFPLPRYKRLYMVVPTEIGNETERCLLIYQTAFSLRYRYTNVETRHYMHMLVLVVRGMGLKEGFWFEYRKFNELFGYVLGAATNAAAGERMSDEEFLERLTDALRDGRDPE